MEILKVTEFLNFTKIQMSASGKTMIIGVGNNNAEKLGMIKWYGPWRKYVFQPLTTDAVFDTKCLIEIGDFLTGITKKQRSDNKLSSNEEQA